MRKGRHQKKRSFRLIPLVIFLLSGCALSTGILLGWQLSKEDQTFSSISGIQTPKLSTPLTPEEQQLSAKIDQLLQKADYIGSIYVRKNNRVIFEKGYGYANEQKHLPNSPALYYQIGSIQKAMTALLILKQVEQGNLTLETKLADFYPKIPGSQKITIKDLLYMRSGLHRTASPDKPMSDNEVIRFALAHLKFTDYHTYHYEPLNFTLLTGILLKLTNQPYETLLKKELIQPLQLKQTNFYEQIKNSPQHAISYQMSAKNDYWKALSETETDIRNELGTGNISMSVYDLDAFFTKVLSGKLIPKDLLFSLWQDNGTKHPYNGGVYSGNNYLLAQGNINRFHAVLAMKKDTSDAVVMESNVQADKKFKTPATDLRNKIYDLIEGSNQLSKG